jgi:hypothetical protein
MARYEQNPSLLLVVMFTLYPEEYADTLFLEILM